MVALLLAGAAVLVTINSMKGGTRMLTAAAMLSAGMIWVVAGRRVWWAPVMIAVSMGGLFWLGFRIYSHEIALAASLAALLPAIALKDRSLTQHRPELGWPAYALLIYLLFHLSGSLIAVRFLGESGQGNVARAYMNALWPMIFTVAVYHFGSLRSIKVILGLIMAALIFRTLIGLYSYFVPGFLFFPALNVFFLLSESQMNELRDAPLRLLIISLALLGTASLFRSRALLLGLALMSAWLLLLGSSRVTVAMLGLIPLFWLFVQRRHMALFLLAACFGIGVAYLNANPEAVYALPRGTQRALSILILGGKLEIHATLEGSNLWHESLAQLGFRKWAQNAFTFLFGNRIHPFDMTYYSYGSDFFHRVDIAASVARYERSLWTVLATTGLTGALLYLATFYLLLRGPVLELVRHRVTTLPRAIYFIATAHTLLFLLFTAVHGGFPGLELAWAGVARALYEDEKFRHAQTPAVPQKPLRAGGWK